MSKLLGSAEETSKNQSVVCSIISVRWRRRRRSVVVETSRTNLLSSRVLDLQIYEEIYLSNYKYQQQNSKQINEDFQHN